ncbi:hypothetical protein [Faucicola boevrei]|nr:hypothetical protein [Moraxella boevrei]
MTNLSHYEILQRKFDGENSSFLMQLRCDLYWDKLALERLVKSRN